MNKGILYAILAYFLWGIFPIYWKLIRDVPALEIIAHRIIWAFLFVLLAVWLKRDWQWVRGAFQDKKIGSSLVSRSYQNGK